MWIILFNQWFIVVYNLRSYFSGNCCTAFRIYIHEFFNSLWGVLKVYTLLIFTVNQGHVYRDIDALVNGIDAQIREGLPPEF